MACSSHRPPPVPLTRQALGRGSLVAPPEVGQPPSLGSGQTPAVGGSQRERHFVWGLFSSEVFGCHSRRMEMKKGVQGWDPLLAALLCSPCSQRPHSKAVLSVRTAQSQRVQVD